MVVGCRGHWEEEGERQGWVIRVCAGEGGGDLRVEFQKVRGVGQLGEGEVCWVLVGDGGKEKWWTLHLRRNVTSK